METKKAPDSPPSESEQDGFHVRFPSRGDNDPVALPPRKEKVDLNWKELQQLLKNSRVQGHAGVAEAAQKFLNEKKKQTGDHVTLEHIFGHDKGLDSSSSSSSRRSIGWLARRFATGDNCYGSTPPAPLKRFTAPMASGPGKRSAMISTSISMNLSGHNGNRAVLNLSGHNGNRNTNIAAGTSAEDVEENFQTQSNAELFMKRSSTSTAQQSSNKGLMNQIATNVKLCKLSLDLSQSRQSASQPESVSPTSSHAPVSGLGTESLTPPPTEQRGSTISIPASVMSLRSASKFLNRLRSPANPETSDRDEPPKPDDQAAVANSKPAKETKGDTLLEDFVPRRSSVSNGNNWSVAQKKRRSIIDQKVRRISMADVVDEAMAAAAKTADETSMESPELTSLEDSKPSEHSRRSSTASTMELFPKRRHLLAMDSTFIDGLLVFAPDRESRIYQMDMSVDGMDMSDNDGYDFDDNGSLGDDSIRGQSTDADLDAGQRRQPSGPDELLEDFPTRSRHRSVSTDSLHSGDSPRRPRNVACDDHEETPREIAIPVEAA
jgi:hypothetical protein